MVSKFESFTTVKGPLTVFIPLQFWFCRNPGLALPLIALQNTDIYVDVKFRDFNSCVSVLEKDNNGNLFHLAHYKNGQEEGVQKLWYENGKIRANYIILNGKRFGLLGTKNCLNVKDSLDKY